jgi:hypothetical protein
MMAQGAWAEAGKGTQNKVTAYLTPGLSEKQAVITIWMANVNPVIGITLPFKFSAGNDTLRLDSVQIAGGRAAGFVMTSPQFKTEQETFLVNMISAVDSTTRKMTPIPVGEGPLMWLYVRTDGKFPMDKLRMASVQLPPQNVLLYVIDSYATVNPSFELIRKAPPSSPAQSKEAKGGKKS